MLAAKPETKPMLAAIPMDLGYPGKNPNPKNRHDGTYYVTLNLEEGVMRNRSRSEDKFANIRLLYYILLAIFVFIFLWFTYLRYLFHVDDYSPYESVSPYSSFNLS